MNALRRRLQPLSWIACLAVLSMALLPTMSHALAFMQGGQAPWAEVCSAKRNLRLVAASEGGAALGAHAAIEHCAWCGLPSTDLAPPPHAARAKVVAGSSEPPVCAWAAGEAQRRAWTPTLPRAPPARA